MKSSLRYFSVLVVSMLFAVAANAQATRTWVSGVGDDVNPCSRTAPCKTFAGAISKTATGGEITVLDPGGYGTITITKSITIDGNGVGSILASASPAGVTINAAGAVVHLKRLSINGAGTTLGQNGIRVLSAAKVHIDDVSIYNFSARGISLSGTTPTQVHVRNTTISNISTTAFVALPSTGTADLRATIENSSITNNGVGVSTAGGIFVGNGGRVMVTNTRISNNTAPGVQASTGGQAFIDNCDVSWNEHGVRASGGTVHISRSTLNFNTNNAVSVSAGAVFSFGDNRMTGNGVSNATGSPANPGLQ